MKREKTLPHGTLIGALAAGLMLALVVLMIAVQTPVDADEGEDDGSNSNSCPKQPENVPRLVPGAEVQDGDCLRDLTTAGTQETGHTDRNDWDGLNAEGTNNPSGVPGLQVDGYFPDSSKTNTNNGYCMTRSS